jgi:hypothetical protein
MEFIIKQLLLGIVSKIVTSKFNVAPEAKDIHEKILDGMLNNTSITEFLKHKLDVLEDELTAKLKDEIHVIADGIREKSPWYIDKVVDIIEDQAKSALDTASDALEKKGFDLIDEYLSSFNKLSEALPKPSSESKETGSPVAVENVTDDSNLTELQKKARAVFKRED